VPGAGLNVPIWILGSSLYGAQLAAALGLPYAFASHFAPAQLMEAIAVYRARFEPSEQLAAPYVMLGVNIIAAETDQEARLLASSQRQAFTSLRQGRPIQLPPPSEEWQRAESAGAGAEVDRALKASIVGSAAVVRQQVATFIEETQADELMIAAQIYDHAARLRSYEITASLRS
jgi:luciferase family oxidoreductase group 1